MLIFDKLKIEIAGKAGTASLLIERFGGRGYDSVAEIKLSEQDVSEILTIVASAERDSKFR